METFPFHTDWEDDEIYSKSLSYLDSKFFHLVFLICEAKGNTKNEV